MAKTDVEVVIKGTDKASGVFKGIGKSFQKIGIGMVAVGAAIGGGLLALAKSAADFEGAMREVNTMIGLSNEAFIELSKNVQEVSREVGISSTELSGALYQIVSAGVEASAAIDVLGVASKAAVAGVTSVETAADGLTTVLNAFKIPAKDVTKVADIMFTTVKRGKTTFDELSKSLFSVAPMAASAGVKFEEVAAAVATVTKQGVPTSVATTQLRAAIQAIIKPTADMVTALENVGYASGEALLQEVGLSRALTLLRDNAGGSLAELGAMFGSVEALGAVLALTGANAATFAEDIKATSEDAAGSVEEAYDEMNKGIGRQFQLLTNNLKVTGQEIGAALFPVLQQLLDKIVPIVKSISDWIGENPKLIEQLFKVATVLVGAGGLLIALSLVSKAIVSINTALAIMHGLSGPKGWASLAAGLVVAGGAIYGITQLMGGDEGTPELQPSELPTPEGIPELGKGAIVTGPTIARIGEAGPEIVAPLGEALGNTVHIHVGNFIGDDSSIRQFARMVKEVLGEDSRRNAFGGVNQGYYYGRSSL